MNNFFEENVPDPTDFPPGTEAPGLRPLDEALRCTICRELFEAPVTVNCSHGHCFCSLCIREQMNTKQECPLCRQAIAAAHIRRNPIVEDILKAWKLSRPFILDLLEERRPTRPSTPPARSVTPQSLASPRKKRRRSSPSSDEEIVEMIEPSKFRRTSHGKPNSSSTSTRGSTTRSTSAIPLVQCPICNKEMTEDIINRHLDNNCRSLPIGVSSPKKRKTQTQQWSRLFRVEESASNGKGKGRGKPGPELDMDKAEPLPKMAYDTVTIKTIRERLSEYSLPTEGEKPVLAARHQRWVAMFNANLDASPSERKTLQQLRKELRKREENEASHKVRKAQPHNADFKTYEKDNKLIFAQLIEQARHKSPKETPITEAPKQRDLEIQDEAVADEASEFTDML